MTQLQRLTAQQVMVVRMLEMPLAQLEQNVQTEMDENPALEGEQNGADDLFDNSMDINANNDDDNDDDGIDNIDNDEQIQEKEDREDELDKVLNNIDSDDRMESANYDRNANNDPDADQEERIFGNTQSFYDILHDQMREQSMTERQEMIMEYLIGSLDSDGLLRKDLATISDEIAIQEYIDIKEEEIQPVLNILQSFDPAGIGAQSLQQCLLIQIFRKKPTTTTALMRKVISDYYDMFTKKHWGKIAEKMHMDEYTAQEVFDEIKHLNPRPGAALGETIGRNTEQITPDFTIDSDDNGNVSFQINNGKIPQLYVSKDFEEMIDTYRQNPTSMTRRDKEALVYAQQKVNRARMYIDAIKQRQHTIAITMKTLIELQHKYLTTGDESDLKPMILKDVAERTGLDISTISRVCNSKYAETPWGNISLKSLFSDGYNTGNGDEVSTREIKKALKELINEEEKGKPLSDIKLAAELKKMGYPIARRTVAKYREQLNIPPSNLRK